MPIKNYDEVKKAFDVYLNRIGYHYKYFGSYMDEIKALQKAVEDFVGQIKEQGRDADDFAMISATELANYFKGYVESLEDAVILLSGVIDKFKINIEFVEKNRILKKIYFLICMEHVKKNEMLYFEKGR